MKNNKCHVYIMIMLSLFFIIQNGWCANEKHRIVRVNNVNDLYNNIAPNTTILLSPGEYHLEKIDNSYDNEYCNWAWVLFDEITYNETVEEDKTLLIQNADNFHIKSIGGKNAVKILTNRKSATVLAFKNCMNISIEGVTIGHNINYTDEPWESWCSGEVSEFFDCENIQIKKSVLFGCGTRGFLLHRCKDFTLQKSTIKECSFGAFGIFESENIFINKSTIKNNKYRRLIEIEQSRSFSVKKTAIVNNQKADEYAEDAIKISGSTNINMNGFTYTNNDFKK